MKRTNKKKKTIPGVLLPEDEVDHVTNVQQAFNHIHQQARARVETPFGWAKNKFPALQKAWAEPKAQQDYLVLFAFALRNSTLSAT